MTYEAALNKAWQALDLLIPEKSLSLRFIADEYSIDVKARKVLSLSCNVPAKEFSAVLILHYLARKIKGLPPLSGEWLTFRELAGIEGYLDAFKKRAIEPIIRKYGRSPDNLLSVIGRIPSRKADLKDVSIIVDAFEGVPVLIKLSRPDEEFGPDANILFDRSVTAILPVEDIIVLAGIVAHSL